MVLVARSGKAVTRVELYDAVHKKGVTRSESAVLVELFFKQIYDCIERGEQVKLASFGTFTVRKKRERMGRNPKTGIEVPIPPRRVVTFNASAIMKRQVNTGRSLRHAKELKTATLKS